MVMMMMMVMSEWAIRTIYTFLVKWTSVSNYRCTILIWGIEFILLFVCVCMRDACVCVCVHDFDCLLSSFLFIVINWILTKQSHLINKTIQWSIWNITLVYTRARKAIKDNEMEQWKHAEYHTQLLEWIWNFWFVTKQLDSKQFEMYFEVFFVILC